MISILITCVLYFVFIKKKDEITKKIKKMDKNSKKNDEFKKCRRNKVDNLISLYSSDNYSLEEMLKRKNYLTSYESVTSCIASSMFSAFVIGFSNYIVYSVVNTSGFRIEDSLVDTGFSIVTSLGICVVLYNVRSLYLSNDFDKYNTNAFEIALIDLYIEKNTGISTKGILDELENKISN